MKIVVINLLYQVFNCLKQLVPSDVKLHANNTCVCKALYGKCKGSSISTCFHDLVHDELS